MLNLEKVFKAYDIRGLYGEEVNEELAWKVGHAAGQFLRSLLGGFERGQASSNRLVVGRDMRPHSKSLCDALIEGISSSGQTCVDIGMVDTPMVYFAVNHLGACGGIMVTASHNPIRYNGFKICAFKAKPVGSTTGLNEVKHIVGALKRMPKTAAMAEVIPMDLWDDYRKHILRFLTLPRPLKVVVDASNGMGGAVIPKVFDGTDLEIIPLNMEMDGHFAHEPNPIIESNLEQVKAEVKKQKADLGICMDGDADRCSFIDEKGNSIRCDIITALLSRHFVEENPGAMVVYDLRSSRVVAEEISAAGGIPKRNRVGHAFIKKTMADGNAIFGGELSGHFYFRENSYCDNGAMAFATVVSVLAAQNKPFSELIDPLFRYSHSGEMNFEVDDKQAKMKEIEQKFSDAEIDWMDGVSCHYDDWWCNVRPSNTEPLLRLNMEAKTDKMLEEKMKVVTEILGQPVKE